MVAKIVPMPPPVQITDEDLEIVDVACRDNAARCRRKGAIEEAATWTRLVEKIARRRHRDGRASPDTGRLWRPARDFRDVRSALCDAKLR